MKRSIFSILVLTSAMSFAQETVSTESLTTETPTTELEVQSDSITAELTVTEFVSDHYILNNSSADIEVVIDLLNKKVTTDAQAETFVIAPGAEVKISSIVAKDKFSLPSVKYIVQIKNVEGVQDPNLAKNWELTKIDETHGKYIFTYHGTSKLPTK